MLKIKKVTSNQMFLWVVMFSIVITTTDTVFFGTNANVLWPKLVQSCLLLIGMVLLLKFIGQKKSIPLKKIVVLVLMSLLVFITGVVNDDLRFGYIYKIGLFVFSLCITEYISIEEFSVHFDKIMYFLAIVSLVGFTVVYLYPDVLNYASVVTNTAGHRFYNFWLFIIYADDSYLRNYSIFREPGVYQMYLIIACLLQIYYLPIFNLKKIFIYSIALITTFSTTGYIAFSMMVILALTKNPPILKRKKTFFCSIMLVCLCLCLVALLQPDILSFAKPVFSKFSEGDVAFVSFFARQASIIVNFNLWLKGPLFGIGLTDIDKLFPIFSEQLLGMSITSNTNTFFVQLAAHGLLYCGIWVFGFLRGACLLGNTAFERLLLFGIVFVFSIGQNLTFCPIANVFLWYCLFGKGKKTDRLYETTKFSLNHYRRENILS